MNNLSLLTDDHTDVLAEVFNMGMGHSIGALSKLCGKDHEILFTTPSVSIISKDDFLSKFESGNRTAMILQEYSGGISGKAVIYFPSTAGKELARLLIGTDVPIDKFEKVESDALIEIGNIFINSSIGCLANFLGLKIITKIPELVFHDKLVSKLDGLDDIIFLSAGFHIEHMKLKGEVAFILDNESVKKFLAAIENLVG